MLELKKKLPVNQNIYIELLDFDDENRKLLYEQGECSLK